MSETPPAARPEAPRSPEDYRERIGRLSVLRHGYTSYTEEYPDLSDRGKKLLEGAGKDLKNIVDENEEELLFFHSPAPRAKGSLGHLLKGFGRITEPEEAEVEKHGRVIGQLRAVKKINPAEAQAMIRKSLGTETPTAEDYENFDRIYALSDEYENSPHWEPKSSSERRASRVFRYALETFIKNHQESQGGKIPHAVVVAHFETVSHIAVKIFGLDYTTDQPFARGERITFDVQEKPGDEKVLLLKCSFRGQERNAWYDRASGEITPA
jgi:hypothetical protein